MLSTQYQNVASYITLAISDWVKHQNLNLGEFNRVLFQEASTDEDFMIVMGTKTLKVDLLKDFKSLDQFSNAQVTHDYFKRKYIEGFKRFDAHFGLNLTPDLIVFLEDYFKNGLMYEKEMKSKRMQGHKYQVVKCYKYNTFDLMLRITDKQGVQLSEAVIFEMKPDPYIVYFDVNKVEINEDCIRVINRNDKLTTTFFLKPESFSEVH
jgi:hypothetical protein